MKCLFSAINLLLIIIFGLTLTRCKKGDEATSNPTIPPITTTDSTLNRNVIVIDSTKLILTSDTTLLNQGHLEYTVVGSSPAIKINDIIVGATNGGYIRKVSSITLQQNKFIIESTQGTMEDVFNNVRFNFTTGMDGLKELRPMTEFNEATTMTEFNFDISGSTLYQNGPVTIKLDKGVINIGGDWDFDFDFKNSKLENFVLECKNASYKGQFDFSVTANQAFNLVDTTVTLRRVAKYFTKVIVVGVVPVPVVVYMEVELRGKLSASIESKVDEIFSVNSNATMDLGLSYNKSGWQTTFNKTSSSSIAITKFNDNLKAKLEVGIIPYISFRLYRIAGPYASFGLKELVKGDVILPAGDWDFYAGAWLQTVLGARAGIFSNSWANYNMEWNTDTIYYQTPDKIERTSGDNQKGTANEFLSQPLKVRIVDFKGTGQSKVPVYFSVINGGGSVETTNILTDKDGYAQTRWKLGSQNIIQIVEVKVKKADGTLINGAPLDFAASAAPSTVATLTTNPVNSITQTSAVSGGNITNDGGTSVTTRGICWSTSQSPTIANSKTSDGTGSGNYTSTITGLITNTTYYVRAYATNTTGTNYGNEISFTTVQANIPTLTTSTVGSITQTTAISGGNVTNEGGANVTARGICWSTALNPTIALQTKTNDGTGTGFFNSNLTGLTANTTYYLRAYATNNAGTAYGNEISFKTAAVDTFTYTARYWVPGTITNSTIILKLHFNNGNITGRASTPMYPFWGPVTGVINGTTMTLNFEYDNGVTPACNFVYPPIGCPSCQLKIFPGGTYGVKENWSISGTVNNDHSQYTATYARKITTTQIIGNGDANCTFSEITNQAIENGNLAY